jgi:hypothetical protein
MITTAIGVSENFLDTREATSEVVDSCKKQMGDRRPQAGILFTSLMEVDFGDLLRRINREFPGVKLIGCTTDGEIVPGRGFIDDALVLILFASERVEFATSVATDLSTSATEAFYAAFNDCRAQLTSDPVFGITLPDGLSTVGISLDEAIQLAMGRTFPIFGGTAGDAFQFTGTYQFYNDSVFQDAAPLLLMGGDIVIESKICTGLVPIGPYYTIDSFKDNIAYTINGRKASEIYEKLLGEYAYEQQASQFPLAIFEDESPDFYLRDPLQVNKEDGSVTFIGNFPEKFRARFTVVHREDVLQSANDALSHILDENDDTEFIFIFSCTSRRHFLGSKTRQELERLLNSSNDIPFCGFYCYGEIGPTRVGRPTKFHNDTFIAVGIRPA